MNLCILYGSRNKQQPFPCTSLTYCFFITEAESVYCAVRSKSLIQFSLIRLLSRRPGLDSRQVHARFVMDKLVLGDRFVSKYFGFPLLIFHESCILSSSACCSYQDKVRSLRPPTKAMVFRKLGIIWCKNTFI